MKLISQSAPPMLPNKHLKHKEIGSPPNKRRRGSRYWYDYGILFPDMGTIFIAIDECTVENGCLQLLRGSHKCERIDHSKVDGQFSPQPERLNFLKEKLITDVVEMKPGDAVFFHCNTLHMSEVNTSSKRRIGFPIAYNRSSNNPTKKHHHPCYTPIEKGELYLVHWKNYPIHDVTWEPKLHLPDSCLQSYKNPQISPDCLKIYSRLLEEAIQGRLASRNQKVVISLPTDAYKFIFGTLSASYINKDTFESKLYLSDFWFRKLNVHGQGVELNFPVKVNSSVYFRTVYVPSPTKIAIAKKVPVERLILTTSTSVFSL